MKRRAVAILLVAIICASPMLAIFGLGDIVYDPWNEVHLISQLKELNAQYRQLVQTYSMITKQYEQMKWNAKYLVRPSAWRAMATRWSLASAPRDTHGRLAKYINAINRGLDVVDSYNRTARSLTSWRSFRELPGAQADHAKAQFATVEMADSAAIGTMDIVGRIRSNAAAVEGAIDELESDSLSEDAALNTEVSVLNRINAALMIALRNQQDTNKLLVGLSEHQIVETKRDRDAEAAAIESDVAYREDGRAVLEGLNAGTTAAIRAWRLP